MIAFKSCPNELSPGDAQQLGDFVVKYVDHYKDSEDNVQRAVSHALSDEHSSLELAVDGEVLAGVAVVTQDSTIQSGQMVSYLAVHPTYNQQEILGNFAKYLLHKKQSPITLRFKSYVPLLGALESIGHVDKCMQVTVSINQ